MRIISKTTPTNIRILEDRMEIENMTLEFDQVVSVDSGASWTGRILLCLFFTGLFLITAILTVANGVDGFLIGLNWGAIILGIVIGILSVFLPIRRVDVMTSKGAIRIVGRSKQLDLISSTIEQDAALKNQHKNE